MSGKTPKIRNYNGDSLYIYIYIFKNVSVVKSLGPLAYEQVDAKTSVYLQRC